MKNEKTLRDYRVLSGMLNIIKNNCDLIFFITIIAALNSHMAGLFELNSLILIPDAVKNGEWWRLFTHPFVHVSWYHLVLDAGAFLVLYSALQKKAGQRFAHTFICGVTSFLLVCFFSAKVSDIGFCGLSGIAHGLMIILSLEMIFDSKKFFQSQKSRTGFICFVIIIIKCTFELTGNEINRLFHFDLCGNPLYESHIGGVIGGIVSFFVLEYRSARNSYGFLLGTEEINHAKV